MFKLIFACLMQCIKVYICLLFQGRLIHMTLDNDVEVAVKAIKLATLLYKYVKPLSLFSL